MDKPELDAHNRDVIAEFRARRGTVGGPYETIPLLLLHHVGAKTSTPRLNPLAFQELDHGVAVFGSNDAAPANPDWYHNLRAHPAAMIEIAGEITDVVARVATGDERDRIWSKQKQFNPLFAEFERRTTRQIPVVVLEPRRQRGG